MATPPQSTLTPHHHHQGTAPSSTASLSAASSPAAAPVTGRDVIVRYYEAYNAGRREERGRGEGSIDGLGKKGLGVRVGWEWEGSMDVA